MQYKKEVKTYQTVATSDHAQSLSTLLLISYLEFTEKKLKKRPASSNSSKRLCSNVTLWGWGEGDDWTAKVKQTCVLGAGSQLDQP